MILAAGGGTRLQPLTDSLPKPVAPIANVPCMQYIVELLKQHGFDDLMVNIFHLGHHIENHFGDGSRFGVRIQYSREKELCGTAGGVKRVEDFFKAAADEPFLVIGGDDLTDFDLSRAIEFHRTHRSLATIGLTEVDDPSEYGVVVTEPDGRITAFQEKPKREEALSNLVNTGVYVFDPSILDLIPAETFYDFGRQLFPLLVERALPFFGCRLEGYWCDVGDLHQYARSHEDVVGGRTRFDVPGREVRPGLFLQDGAQVADDVVVEGRALIGAGARIEAGCTLAGTVVLGPGTVVGTGSELRNLVTWDGVEIGPNCRLRGSILGSGCQLGAGSELGSFVLAPATRLEGTARALRLTWS